MLAARVLIFPFADHHKLRFSGTSQNHDRQTNRWNDELYVCLYSNLGIGVLNLGLGFIWFQMDGLMRNSMEYTLVVIVPPSMQLHIHPFSRDRPTRSHMSARFILLTIQCTQATIAL